MVLSRDIAAAGSGVFASLVVLRWILDRPSRRLACLLGGNYSVLDREEKKMAEMIMKSGNSAVLRFWSPNGVRDAEKKRLIRATAKKLNDITTSVTTERLEALKAPAALQIPKEITEHGDTRVDQYYWLRDDERADESVLAHLAAENKYCKAVLADTEPAQKQIFAEMKGRIQEADETVPLRKGRYFYYSRTLEGKQYRVTCRREIPVGPPLTEASTMDTSMREEILLDENREARKYDFYMVGGMAITLDGNKMAYSEDTNGSEKFTIYVKDLETGKQLLKKGIVNTSGSVVFAADHETMFYVMQDSKHRPYQVWRHTLGTDVTDDMKVFQEDDEAYCVGCGRSRDNQLVLIETSSSITSETRYVHAKHPNAEFKVILPRTEDVEYEVQHWHGNLIMVMRTAECPNSQVVVAPLDCPTEQRVALAHRPDVKIEDIVLSHNFVSLFERMNGLQQCIVFPLGPDRSCDKIVLENGSKLAMDEPAYLLCPYAQEAYESDLLMLTYTSLTTPTTVLCHNMATGTRVEKKVQPVLGGFEKSDYVTERIWAPAEDGVLVPISLVYNRHKAHQGTPDALHLDVYGAYEVNNDPSFSANRVSLLDRGVVYAIAHVRGGGEMGRPWYEDGKFLNKRNTFTDTVTVMEYLIKQGWTTPGMMTLEGRSAGGMTVGAVTNMRPDLFTGVVMGVPFVDCLTTMLDESIPLTIGEYEEWGNPHDEEYYNYMKTYSPVDNVVAQDYPNILVTGGLHDPRVAYWEPAKLVAKLRRFRTNRNILVFKCEMGAGHFSQSGRFDRLKELALDYAFVLKCNGKLTDAL